MKRRHALGLLASTGVALPLTSSAYGMRSVALDPYGGWLDKHFEATGFFRTHHDGERWWLVTPDGNAFLSFGINHLYPDLFNQDYNRQAWSEILGVNPGQAPEYYPALREWFLRTCELYGFNTVGVHNALQVTNRPQPGLPYMQPIRFVDIPHWKSDVPNENFRDVFSAEFARHCDGLARRYAAPIKEDPYLLGYSMTDCPLLTVEDCRERPDVIGGARRESRIGWPQRLRNLGSEAPGKMAYVTLIRSLYRDSIRDFNQTYATNFADFEGLANARDWRSTNELSNPFEVRDNTAFLQACVDQYYTVCLAAIRKYDSNHLFFGDKLNANTDSLDTVLPITSKHTDAVLYQMYARYEVQKPGLDRWSAAVDQPFVNGDSAFTMITETMPRPYGPVADNLQQRADWTAEFFQRAFARPEFVGWHYCGLIDASQNVARKQARQHSGLLDGFGQPYGPVQKVLLECSKQMYQLASG